MYIRNVTTDIETRISQIRESSPKIRLIIAGKTTWSRRATSRDKSKYVLKLGDVSLKYILQVSFEHHTFCTWCSSAKREFQSFSFHLPRRLARVTYTSNESHPCHSIVSLTRNNTTRMLRKYLTRFALEHRYVDMSKHVDIIMSENVLATSIRDMERGMRV